MIRLVDIAFSCLPFLVLLIIIRTDWSSPDNPDFTKIIRIIQENPDYLGKALGIEFKQQHYGPALCGPACPAGWLTFEGKCYFFSEERKDWGSSQSFCASYGSSLAVIETVKEKVFILNYVCSVDHWIGLGKDADQSWKWIDGTELNNMLDVKGGGGECAFLNSDSAVSSRCHRIRNWICSHPYIDMKKKQFSATK